MRETSEENIPGKGNLRLKANGATGGSTSPETRGASADRSPATSGSLPCTVDGGVLLETEHVLLRVAPHLLTFTDRIRREGWIRPAPTDANASFRQYALIVPIEAVRQILVELERASAVYCPEYLPMMRLVEHWREIYDKCV